MPAETALSLGEQPSSREVTWIPSRSIDRTLPQVVFVSLCACYILGSGSNLTSVFKMHGLGGLLSQQLMKTMLTMCLRASERARPRILTDILGGEAEVLADAEGPFKGRSSWGKWELPLTLARGRESTAHSHRSHAAPFPWFTCRFDLTLFYFKLLNNLRALGNYFLKYTSILNKAI